MFTVAAVSLGPLVIGIALVLLVFYVLPKIVFPAVARWQQRRKR